ncbi:hypothetical protein FHR51_002549 [Xanthomonas arboricola]|uniref:hypothetical protein n=1 Tax=Xanthomonas cannabis TaxID=1885674 RepID=UPI0016097620|nr:hypothetical protein [Xanthomonas cannabis]MBB3806397.1 hypothetical protein [Xanthomonas cannabis]
MNEIESGARELLAHEFDSRGLVACARAVRSGEFDHWESMAAISTVLSAAPLGLPHGLVQAARDALPFVAYAYSKGVAGAEEAGRAIETALADMPKEQGEGAYHHALQRIGGAIGLPAGSDLTTQCIPAIEAMRRDADRWQFVRAGSPSTIRLDGRMQPHGITGLVPHYFHGRDEQELDALIDKAMLAAKPELTA